MFNVGGVLLICFFFLPNFICFCCFNDAEFCRWVEAESSKYDVERDVHIKEMQIHDLEMEVSDMRGKFILPKLKKVHNFKLMGGEE